MSTRKLYAMRPVRLNDYLKSINLPGELKLPWAHSTSASKLIDIIADGKLMATPCNVFKGEKLCYLFVGRPAYKMAATENPSVWQLPVAFVIRFQEPPPIKRIFPFDSGAFRGGRLPGYITMFQMDGYDLAGSPDLVGRLVSLCFRTPERYFLRRPAGEDEIAEEHQLDVRHQEIRALTRLFHERSSPDCDDRAAVIEVQVEQDIELRKDNLLGIVMPAEYSRWDQLMHSIREITPNVQTYDHMPLSLTSHFYAIYQGVREIYKMAGVAT